MKSFTQHFDLACAVCGRKYDWQGDAGEEPAKHCNLFCYELDRHGISLERLRKLAGEKK